MGKSTGVTHAHAERNKSQNISVKRQANGGQKQCHKFPRKKQVPPSRHLCESQNKTCHAMSCDVMAMPSLHINITVVKLLKNVSYE